MKESGEFLGNLLGGHSRIHAKTRPVVMAVMGTDKGVGTTHFCVAAVNFLNNVRGLKAGIVELNMNPVRQRLENFGDNVMSDYIKSFEQIQGDKRCYDVIILDISKDYPSGVKEFARSDVRFITGSLSVWKADRFIQVIERMSDSNENCDVVCLSLAFDRQTAKKIKRKYGIDVIPLPYIENPLKLKPADCAWLNKALENIWTGGLHTG